MCPTLRHLVKAHLRQCQLHHLEANVFAFALAQHEVPPGAFWCLLRISEVWTITIQPENQQIALSRFLCNVPQPPFSQLRNICTSVLQQVSQSISHYFSLFFLNCLLQVHLGMLQSLCLIWTVSPGLSCLLSSLSLKVFGLLVNSSAFNVGMLALGS